MSAEPTPRERFAATYRVKLAEARAKNPGDYPWPDSELDAVVERMTVSFARGGASWGPASRATCRALGVALTYSAVKAFLAGEVAA